MAVNIQTVSNLVNYKMAGDGRFENIHLDLTGKEGCLL